MLTCVLLGTGLFVPAQTKYGVTVRTAKADALAKAKTYVWTRGNPSFDPSVHTMIVAAVDRELGARGFTKLPSGKSDLEVNYASVTRTDTDLKSKSSKSGALPGYLVGTLVVDLTAVATRDLLFRVRMDTPIQNDPATIEAAINGAVAAMFQKYPTPSKR